MRKHLYITLCLLLLYVTAMGCWTIYFANHFNDFASGKGDETKFVGHLFLSSLGFQLLVLITTGRRDWIAIVLSTVANVFVSFIIGLIIVLTFNLKAIPYQIILIYGACYLTYFSVVVILQAFRMRNYGIK
jgi:hypothetical protein